MLNENEAQPTPDSELIELGDVTQEPKQLDEEEIAEREAIAEFDIRQQDVLGVVSGLLHQHYIAIGNPNEKEIKALVDTADAIVDEVYSRS